MDLLLELLLELLLVLLLLLLLYVSITYPHPCPIFSSGN